MQINDIHVYFLNMKYHLNAAYILLLLLHFICNTMRDDTDILCQRRQLYARANVLARKVYMCTDEVKILLFRTFCCNLYTCQLWWNFTQTAMRKINVAYNNAFRMIMQQPRYCILVHLIYLPCVLYPVVKQSHGTWYTDLLYVCI